MASTKSPVCESPKYFRKIYKSFPMEAVGLPISKPTNSTTGNSKRNFCGEKLGYAIIFAGV